MGPAKYVTESEVLVIVNRAFSEYESSVGMVRHRENGIKFEKLIAAFNKMSGAIWAVGSIFTAVMAGLEIYRIAHK